jgi:hypothetical protein
MDANRFDNLLRSLVDASSRRGIARAVTGMLLAGPFAVLLDATDAAAKKKKRKKKKCKGGARKCGKKCIPATSCCTTADCGTGGACAGGACICAVKFRSCQGKCIPDGDCCSSSECGDCQTCQNGQCADACDTGQECVTGQCQCTPGSCPGCCDDNTCKPGNTSGNCGTGGEVCVPCTGGQTCQGGACACTAGQDFCGGSCLTACAAPSVRNPVTCDCCLPTGESCGQLTDPPCCYTGPNACLTACRGGASGESCQFSAQCNPGLTCVDGHCAS